MSSCHSALWNEQKVSGVVFAVKNIIALGSCKTSESNCHKMQQIRDRNIFAALLIIPVY